MKLTLFNQVFHNKYILYEIAKWCKYPTQLILNTFDKHSGKEEQNKLLLDLIDRTYNDTLLQVNNNLVSFLVSLINARIQFHQIDSIFHIIHQIILIT